MAENDLISRSALLADVEKCGVMLSSSMYPSDEETGALKVIYAIVSSPAVDAVPVRHGRWKVLSAGPVAVYGCSLCNTEIPFGKFPDEMRFCPNCGAKMDLEGN